MLDIFVICMFAAFTSVAERRQNNLSTQSTDIQVGSPGQTFPGQVGSRVIGSDAVPSLDSLSPF